MQLIEWEVNEDGYEEQIIIPKEQRDLAAKEGIGTENKQKVAHQILNLNTGETYTGRLVITGNHQLYLPIEIQKILNRPLQKNLGLSAKLSIPGSQISVHDKKQAETQLS